VCNLALALGRDSGNRPRAGIKKALKSKSHWHLVDTVTVRFKILKDGISNGPTGNPEHGPRTRGLRSEPNSYSWLREPNRFYFRQVVISESAARHKGTEDEETGAKPDTLLADHQLR